MRADETVAQFVEAINGGDVGRLAALMTDGHVFVDSDGSKIRGREAVCEAWSRYFGMMAEYAVVVQETVCSGNTVVLVGTATGAWRRHGEPRSEQRWSAPAAWRAVVEQGRVAVWQVFVNPEPIRAALHCAGGTA